MDISDFLSYLQGVSNLSNGGGAGGDPNGGGAGGDPSVSDANNTFPGAQFMPGGIGTDQVMPPDASTYAKPYGAPSRWGFHLPILGGATVTTGLQPPQSGAPAQGTVPTALGVNQTPAVAAPAGTPPRYSNLNPGAAQGVANGAAIGQTVANIRKMIAKMYGGGMGGG